MKILGKLHRYRVYRNLFTSFFILVSLTVILLSVLLYGFFSTRAVRDARTISEDMLRQTSATADFLHAQVLSIGTHLLERNQIVNALYSNEVDRLLEYQVTRIFNELRAIYPFISFVSIYNATNGRYINSEGLTREHEADFLQVIIGNQGTAFLRWFTRTIPFSHIDARNPERVMSFVLYPNLTFLFPPNGFIIVNIDLSYLDQLVRLSNSGSGAEVIVLDENGEVLVDVGPRVRMSTPRLVPSPESGSIAELQSQEMVAEIEAYLNRHGQSEPLAGLLGPRRLIASVTSPVLGWTFISIQSLDEVIPHMRLLWFVTIVISVGLIIAGGLTSYLLAGRIFDPLENLVRRFSRDGERTGREMNEFELLKEAFDRFLNRIGVLEVAAKDNRPLLEIAKGHSILMGMKEEDSTAPRTVVKEPEGTKEPQYYIVVVIRIDRYYAFRSEHSPSRHSLALSSLRHVMSDLLNRIVPTIVVPTEENEFAALLSLADAMVPDTLILELEEIQAMADRQLNASISAGIGTVVNSTEHVHESFHAARRSLDYRFFHGPGSILDTGTVADMNSVFLPYPESTQKHALEQIRLGHPEDAITAVETFSRTIGRLPYPIAVAYCRRFLIELYADGRRHDAKARVPVTSENENPTPERENTPRPEDAQPVDEDWIEGLHDTSMDNNAFEFLDDYVRAMKEAAVRIASDINSRSAKRNAELIEAIKEYIHENYSDPGLNLEGVAEAMGLSSGHVGRVYREHTGETIGEFMNSVRIEHATALLRDTDETAESISRRVGITNSSYFFTLFKKHTGVTPKRYRIRMRRRS